MPDEPDNSKGAPHRREPDDEDVADGALSADGEENDRPTVSPPFDPVAFARDAFRPSPAPMNAVSPPKSERDAHTHATPAHGVAKADGPVRRKTPTSTISLLNARIPSNLPPRPGQKPETVTTAKPPPSADDATEQELPTRPPPADGVFDDPLRDVSRVAPPELDLDLELDVELPPPAPEPLRTSAAAPSGATASAAKRAEPQLSPTAAMNARIELGDYSGALEIAEEILSTDPNHLSARTCAETCRSVLRQMYAARLGPLEGVPVVMVPRDQLRWLSIDHKAGFVLSLVDGVSNLEMIIDVSGMPELDTLRILSELAQQRIIAVR